MIVNLDILYNLLYNLISFTVLITIVVFIHEYGHYFFAKIFGAKILTFSIGFGKKLFSKTDKDGTEWCIGAIPAGGYVKILSREDEEYINNEEEFTKASTMEDKLLWQKIIIALGGPLANILSAFLLMFGLFILYPQDLGPLKIDSIDDTSFEYYFGLKEGDIITNVDDHEIYNYSSYIKFVNLYVKDDFTVTVFREETKLVFNIDLSDYLDNFFIPLLINNDDFRHDFLKGKDIDIHNQDTSKALIIELIKKQPGFTGELNLTKMGLFAALNKSFWGIIDTLNAISIVLYNMVFHGIGFDNLGGPIKIVSISGSVMKQGLLQFVWLIVIISINLAFMNLLPLPMLDGGQVLMYILTYRIGDYNTKRNIEKWIARIGVAFLIFLIVFVSYNDIKSFSIF
ncbi:hypothetical protein GUI12_03205 [Anaplasmataceae bacterium AB001_6]|nr:hypothetical protein GUI12_03205 [Anaplasmataceae bacterium AB001_6]